MKLGGQRSRKNKFVRMVIDDDHEICFGDMKQCVVSRRARLR